MPSLPSFLDMFGASLRCLGMRFGFKRSCFLSHSFSFMPCMAALLSGEHIGGVSWGRIRLLVLCCCLFFSCNVLGCSVELHGCLFLNGEHSEANAAVDSCRVPDPVSRSRISPVGTHSRILHYVVDIWNGFPVSAVWKV